MMPLMSLPWLVRLLLARLQAVEVIIHIKKVSQAVLPAAFGRLGAGSLDFTQLWHLGKRLGELDASLGVDVDGGQAASTEGGK